MLVEFSVVLAICLHVSDLFCLEDCRELDRCDDFDFSGELDLEESDESSEDEPDDESEEDEDDLEELDEDDDELEGDRQDCLRAKGLLFLALLDGPNFATLLLLHFDLVFIEVFELPVLFN